MADLFGFNAGELAYRYRCPGDTAPSNADCFVDFCRAPQPVLPRRASDACDLVSLYTGAAERPACARCIQATTYSRQPRWISSSRLHRCACVSGPTMGRLLQAAMATGSSRPNVPMLHGERWMRPASQSFARVYGQMSSGSTCGGDEFERQFRGDVMLFSNERLVAMGHADARLSRGRSAPCGTPSRVRCSTGTSSSAPHRTDRLEQLGALLHDPSRWWNRGRSSWPHCSHSTASSTMSRITSVPIRPVSHASRCRPVATTGANCQLDAIANLNADREAGRPHCSGTVESASS